MAQNVILQCCDLERSSSSVKVKINSIRPLPFTHKYTCEVSLKSYLAIYPLHYGRAIIDPMVSRRKKKKEGIKEIQFDRRWHFVKQMYP